MEERTISLLVGNGLDIQIGGDDFQNKWIIVRLLAKTKTGKYDILFTNEKTGEPIVSGDDIVSLFRDLVPYANKAANHYYDAMIEKYGDVDLANALKEFRDNHKSKVISIEEIGMEDWLLIFLLVLIEEDDILDQYEFIKQGFERMLLDAIYCEGYIQKLYASLNKSSSKFFSKYNKIFTLNYDGTLEKITSTNVYHLHGDFESTNPSEDISNALGYIRIRKGKNVKFPPEFKHCNCSAIFDFSGNRKYKYATTMTNAFGAFEHIKLQVENKEITVRDLLTKLSAEQMELFEVGIEKNLEIGHNYYFNKFEELTGILEIIGLAPQNDTHIFECINRSSLDSVVFYYYFGNKSDAEIKAEIESISLPINKSSSIRNVCDIWKEAKITKPSNGINIISQRQLEILNALCFAGEIKRDEIIRQLNSIPKFTRNIIVEMLNHEMGKEKYHRTPQNEQEFAQNFKDFSSTLKVAALSPQALLYLYIESNQSSKKITGKKAKNKKRRKRK